MMAESPPKIIPFLAFRVISAKNAFGGYYLSLISLMHFAISTGFNGICIDGTERPKDEEKQQILTIMEVKLSKKKKEDLDILYVS